VIKDNILLQDTVSTFGSLIGGEYRAPYSSTVARRLEQAGFLVVGKTAMDEFAMGTTGENTPFALPHNPYDESRVAGGSSSGSAVAVSTDMVPVAL
jgi:aspartyl-tRNA(Asn)/glutamyl-tRNA(Gln) amidotransferase subunit A